MPNLDDRRIAATGREQRPPGPERIEQLRAKLEAGAYATEAVLQATARAILERRDL